jgi:hypothetical protein
MLMDMRIFLQESAEGKHDRAEKKERLEAHRRKLAELDAASLEAVEVAKKIEELVKERDALLEKFLSPSHGVSRWCGGYACWGGLQYTYWRGYERCGVTSERDRSWKCVLIHKSFS